MPDTAHITFTGELDVARRSEIRERFDGAVGAARTLIDLRFASGVGAMFTSELFRFAKMTREAGGAFAIVATSPHIVKVLRILRAHESAQIFTSERSAERYLAESPEFEQAKRLSSVIG